MMNPLAFIEMFYRIATQGKSKTSSPIFSKGKPVSFPLQNSDLHLGFGNSANNPWGMKAEFMSDSSKGTTCVWRNTHTNFQGFKGIIHGGILFTLADELMANCLVSDLKKFGLSLWADVKWFRPVFIGGVVHGKSQIIAKVGSFVFLQYELQDENSKKVLSGRGLYFLPTVSQIERATKSKVPSELQDYLRNQSHIR